LALRLQLNVEHCSLLTLLFSLGWQVVFRRLLPLPPPVVLVLVLLVLLDVPDDLGKKHVHNFLVGLLHHHFLLFLFANFQMGVVTF